MRKSSKIKCVVWDLDHTLWNGTLLEDHNIQLFDDVVTVIKTFDERGILNSIASKNDYEAAYEKLEQLGILQYFLYPQINWDTKSNSIQNISKLLNIGLDAFAFVDDQVYERKEVAFSCPEVTCIAASDISGILNQAPFMPEFITEDSRMRREMYQKDMERKQAETSFEGPKEEFLQSLGMVFEIKEASEKDLQRAEELTVRTHQLNTTGIGYSYDELKQFMVDPEYKLYIASLDDNFGTYGKIGIALVQCEATRWTIKLFLMSCRVMTRGVGTVFQDYIITQARKAGVELYAEFISNNKNRMMYMTYKFGGFSEVDSTDGITLFQYDFRRPSYYPTFLTFQGEGLTEVDWV